MDIPDAAVEAAAHELASLTSLPRMAAKALLAAGAVNVGTRLMGQVEGWDAETVARNALAAALPHLLPGWFVADGPYGDSTIWAEGTPAHPDRPVLVMARTISNAHQFDQLAALLPDRTDETKD